ncbi:MAG TPA: hypothetical protein VKL40_00115 [Candidatus Angelobacter sp.]|nr:hypothetical protein [Candidatus Angelobacter sp.]
MPAGLTILLLGFTLLTLATAAAATPGFPDRGGFARAGVEATRGPSTEEERQRVIAVTHKLEVTPLDPTLAQERDWARQWLVDVPDIRILTCTGLLAELRRPRYKFRPELWTQLRLASAAFLIEHPDQAGDRHAESLAGMQSVLKAYSAIIKTDPDAHSAFLDDLLVKQNQGKLADFVREATKPCHF